MSNIKIYVSCHKECFVPSNKLLYPIQVGTCFADEIPGILHDNTGDNISEKNKMYCELTAQYWAWKNDDADYYGFFHYRRYLNFSQNKFKANHFQDIELYSNDEETLAKLGIEENTMRELIEKYDVIAPKKGGFASRLLSVYKQYAISKWQEKEDLDYVLDIIKRKHPEMYSLAKKYLRGKKGYFCNMFIMKKDIFNDYSKWLFGILEEHEKSKDFSKYSVEKYRVSGYLAERLCGIYLTYLKKQKNIKFCELQKAIFQKTEEFVTPKPAFEKNNIPVVMETDESYISYTATAIKSMVEHSSNDHNYDIILLAKDVSDRSKKLIQMQMFEHKNFSVRFIDLYAYLKKDNIYAKKDKKINTHTKLILPEVLTEYEKVLYLDSDTIVLEDVSKLYNEPLEDKFLGAVLDFDTIGLYAKGQKKKKDCLDNVLKIKDPYKFFQTGVMLYDLNKFRNEFNATEVIENAQKTKRLCCDKGLLNSLLQNKVKLLDAEWNVLFNSEEKRYNRIEDSIAELPRELSYKYLSSRKNPKIIHFAGGGKPWNNPESDFAEIFWKYARMVPFYETMLAKTVIVYSKTKKRRCRVWNKILDFLFPPGSRRRKLLKKIYIKFIKK